MAAPLVYDVGMNSGDDVEYYLKKGYRVIGIDANRGLCDYVLQKFKNEVSNGRLTVLNVGIGLEPGRGVFHLHKANSLISSFHPAPRLHGGEVSLLDAWKTIEVEVRRLSDVMYFFGQAEYVKIDIEGSEATALRDLAMRGIRPRYISAEANDAATPCWLVSMGYRAFKLGQGALPRTPDDHEISLVGGGTDRHSFGDCSAGPFGEDIPGPWMHERDMLAAWLAQEHKWCDVHAWDGC